MWRESRGRSEEGEDRRVLGPGPGWSPPPHQPASCLHSAPREGEERAAWVQQRGAGAAPGRLTLRGLPAASGSVDCWGRRPGVPWGPGPWCFVSGPDSLPALAPWSAGRPGELGVSWPPAGRMPCNDKHEVGTRYTRANGYTGSERCSDFRHLSAK